MRHLSDDPRRIPVLLGGTRTPFLHPAGAYGPLMAYQLAAEALRAAPARLGVDLGDIDTVALGTVVHETDTSNVAREAMLAAGYRPTTPAYTTSMAGLSPTIAITTIADAITAGRVRLGVAGGVDSFSDVPIRLSRGLRRAAMKLRRDRTLTARLGTLAQLRPRDLALAVPRSADTTTGLTMGAAAERTARALPVARADADAYADRSHQRAVAAWEAGHHARQVTPVTVGGVTAERDDTPRADSDPARLARLDPVFAEGGTITAGNASGFTDGAGATVLSDLATAEQLGIVPAALLRDAVYLGVDDLAEEMLFGPALAIPRLLDRHGLTRDDVAVFEVHEAFATQVLSVQRALADDAFGRDRLGRSGAFGALPEDRLNAWGGSIALGNPFAATGVRLLLTAADRLRTEGGRYAVVASCAGGGLGSAVLLEAPPA